MKLSQRVRVYVSGAEDDSREKVVETARGSVRSRVLSRLLGNRYGLMLIMPCGMHVESVEVVESAKPPPG